MPDRSIKCLDCGGEFLFTEREQEWYREKGLTHEPRRCKACRGSRKSGGGGGPSRGGGHAGGGPSHPDASHPDHGSESPGHDEHGGAPPGDRPRRPPRSREMFKVGCATCGKETEVPFKPDPSRPVYCRDCYVARGKKR